ncbi:hypothetical protein M0805_002577 [Coniferiporia weirii]|nr:hypothetical protein M0805_002577 [Coniferiporia weirii]
MASTPGPGQGSILTRDNPVNSELVDDEGETLAALAWHDVRSDRVVFGIDVELAADGGIGIGAERSAGLRTVTFEDEKKRGYKWKGCGSGVSLELYADDAPSSPIAQFKKSHVRTQKPASCSSHHAHRSSSILSFLEKNRRARDNSTQNKADKLGTPFSVVGQAIKAGEPSQLHYEPYVIYISVDAFALTSLRLRLPLHRRRAGALNALSSQNSAAAPSPFASTQRSSSGTKTMSVGGTSHWKVSFEKKVATLEKVKKLRDFAVRELGCKVNRLAFAWVASQPGTSTVVLGVSRPEQIIDNLKALEVLPRLTPEIMARIDAILLDNPKSGTLYGRPPLDSSSATSCRR